MEKEKEEKIMMWKWSEFGFRLKEQVKSVVVVFVLMHGGDRERYCNCVVQAVDGHEENLFIDRTIKTRSVYQRSYIHNSWGFFSLYVQVRQAWRVHGERSSTFEVSAALRFPKWPLGKFAILLNFALLDIPASLRSVWWQWLTAHVVCRQGVEVEEVGVLFSSVLSDVPG